MYWAEFAALLGTAGRRSARRRGAWIPNWRRYWVNRRLAERSAGRRAPALDPELAALLGDSPPRPPAEEPAAAASEEMDPDLAALLGRHARRRASG